MAKLSKPRNGYDDFSIVESGDEIIENFHLHGFYANKSKYSVNSKIVGINCVTVVTMIKSCTLCQRVNDHGDTTVT